MLMIVATLSFNFGYFSEKMYNKKLFINHKENPQKNSLTCSVSDLLPIIDQRFEANGEWRKNNYKLNKFNCTTKTNNKKVKAYSAVLNTWRKINHSQYIFDNETFLKQYIINTTFLINTNNWERNCQQAHTQVIEAVFNNGKNDSDYVLILEDDALISNEVTQQEFVNTLNCAIDSKINFLSLIHNNETQYWYGTVGYLVSRVFYYDFLRMTCFGTNSPLPIDMCLLSYFYLMVTDKNLLLHPTCTDITTRWSFDLTTKPEADLTRFKFATFDPGLVTLD